MPRGRVDDRAASRERSAGTTTQGSPALGHHVQFSRSGAPSRHRAQGYRCGGQVDAGDLDDGLPRGFLAFAIVEVWLELRLNWTCELPELRGEELPCDLVSELRRLEVPTGRGL